MSLPEYMIRSLDFLLIALNVAAWIVADLQSLEAAKPRGPKINHWK